MQREDMLERVRAAYNARRTGDFDKLRELVAENASWTLYGEESLLAGFPGTGGVDVHEAARQLFETIELRTLDRVDAVAEGNRVAILWKTTAAVPGSEPFETMMFDLWEFDAEGKICKGMQFVDTAKFIAAMRP
jgi:ketosteroid isomerase-like protein